MKTRFLAALAFASVALAGSLQAQVPPTTFTGDNDQRAAANWSAYYLKQLYSAAPATNPQHVVASAAKSGVTATTTSGTVLAANASRTDAVIVNYGATACFLARGATAVSGQGIYLAPSGGAYNIDANNLYRGQITVITTTGTTTLAISEGQ